ncbi:hypothetical protein [Chitinilyticum aquatile]|uniref:hypothetical protein n=1 Tax=Chitinilyticum aquatile TaxID=362520 RepID=UPI000421031B|nr:hypothetical protein [Chitinilyticum aquatile]
MSIPSTTPIYAKRFARIVSLVGCLLLGTFILFCARFAETDNRIALLAVYGLGALCILYPLATLLPQLLQSGKPMLTLSAAGITLRDGTLLPWADIASNQILPVESEQGITVGYRIEVRDAAGTLHAFGLPNITPERYTAHCLHYQRAMRT